MTNMGFLSQGRIYKLTKENVSKVPNTGGVYKLYNDDREHIYTGRASGSWGSQWKVNGKTYDEPHQRWRNGMKRRINRHRQKQHYDEHRTKKWISNEPPEYFMYRSEPDKQKRRALEKNWKNGAKYNYR